MQATAEQSARWAAGAMVTAVPLLLASSASAAPDEEPPELITPPVVVEEQLSADLPEDPSSFTTTIDVEATRGEATRVDELLSESVGVQVRRFGGPGSRSELSIRGSTANQVVVLLDGVRLNTSVSGGVDLASIPTSVIERIEVSRGGGSVWTGSDAIGGVVNLVTKRASGRPRTTAAFSGGSWDTYRGSVTQTGSLFGLEAIAAYDGFATDGDWRFRPATPIVGGVPPTTLPGSVQRVNNDRERHSAYLGLGRDLGTWGRLRLSDSYLRESGGEPGVDSGGGALFGQSLSARRKRDRNVVDLALDVADLGAFALSGRARVYHRYDRNRFRDPTPVLGAPLDTDQQTHALGARGELEREARFAGMDHRVSLGVDLREDWLDQRGGPAADRFVVGVFAQDDIALFDEALRVVPALRFDATDGFTGEWIPRLGVVWAPLSWLRFRSNVERSYRVPQFDELFLNEEFVRGNPNLRPEDAFNVDVGVTIGRRAFGPIRDARLEFVWFRNDIDESIVFARVSPFVTAAANTGAARITGYELAGSLALLDWARVRANWTRIDSKRRLTGRPLPGRADDEIFVRAEVGPLEGPLRIFSTHHYTSSIPVTFGGGVRVNSRFVHGVGAVLDLARVPGFAQRLPGEALLLSVSADNVSDQGVRDTLFFPQPGRALTFRIEWRR